MKTPRFLASLLAAFVLAALTPSVSRADPSPTYSVRLSTSVSLAANPPYGASGGASFMDGAGTYLNVYAGGSSYPNPATYYSSLQTAQLVPQKDYTVSVSLSAPIYNVYVGFEKPVDDGMEVWINGHPSNGISFSSTGTFKLRLHSKYGLAGAPPIGTRAGESGEIVADKPIWYISLGRMRNGDSAGWLGFRKPDFAHASFFTPSILEYDSPDTNEVDVIKSGSTITQVFAREALIKVSTINSTSYKLEAFARSQVGTLSGGSYPTTGNPFATYTISKITSPATGVKIVKSEDGISYETSLILNGSTWTHSPWKVQGSPLQSYIETVATSSTNSTVNHWGTPANGGAVENALTWSKGYTQYSWGKELASTTRGSGVSALITNRQYYTSTGGDGVERALSSLMNSDGSWEKRTYYATDTSSGAKGQLKRAFRPWMDGPASASSATTSNSVYEDWTYEPDTDGKREIPGSHIVYPPGGAYYLSKSTWDYNHTSYSANGYGMTQEIRRDWCSSGTNDYLTTTTFRIRNDVVSGYFQSALVSVARPDGSKDAYAYFNGTWNPSTNAFTASSGGAARAVRVYHGQTSGGTLVNSVALGTQSWSWSAVGGTRMVENQSTVSETITDTTGQVVLRQSYVYTTGGALGLVASVAYKYDSHGRLEKEIDLIRTQGAKEYKRSFEYNTNLETITIEKDYSGVQTEYQYDGLGRLAIKTVGAGGTGDYPAREEHTKYDGAGRVAEQSDCGCASGAVFYAYDSAGRVSTKSETHPNDGEDQVSGDDLLVTSYTYDSPRKTTIDYPNGGDRVEESYLDGRPKSVSGSAQAPTYYDYAYNATGILTTIKNGSTKANGWTEEQRDRLGRVVKRSAPSWKWDESTAPTKIVDVYYGYNAQGQLWREQPMQNQAGSDVALASAKLYFYDGGGRLIREGLDLNNSNSLTDASNDRVLVYGDGFSQDSAGWNAVRSVSTFATRNDPTATEVSLTSSRLTGFSALSGSRILIQETVVTDASERAVTTLVEVDPSTRRVVSSRSSPGVSSNSYQITINGYNAFAEDAAGNAKKWTYDSGGRLTGAYGRLDYVTLFYREQTLYSYYGDTDHVHTMTQNGVTTTFSYAWDDPSGPRKVSAVDEAGATVHTIYDTMDKPWRTWGSGAQPAQFEYDDLGRRESMTTWRTGSFSGADWPGTPGDGATTTWDLDPATGLVDKRQDADSAETTFEYMPMGEVFKRTDPRGVVATYDYFDENGPAGPLHNSHRTRELWTISYSDATPLVEYAYERTGLLGRIIERRGAGDDVRFFTYGTDLQPNEETLGAVTYGSSRKLKALYEDGSGSTVDARPMGYQFLSGSTEQARNALAYSSITGLPTSVSGATGMPSFSYSYSFGESWLETVTSGSYSRFQPLSNTITAIDKVETKWAGAHRGRYDVTYDTETSAADRGLKASVQQWADSGSVLWQSGTTTFSYNARRELEGSDFSVGTSKDFTFAYDLMGKRQSKVQNGATTTYAAVGADQNPIVQTHDVNEYATITGAHAEPDLLYDDNGNMTRDGAWNYAYDAENRLVQMTRRSASSDPAVADRLDFEYDYLSRRTRKTVWNATSGGSEISDTVFVWSGWNLVSELDANAGLAQTRSYLWGIGYAPGGAGALLAVKIGSAVYYPVYDPMGNVTGYLNSSGTTVSAYEYNAYGELTNQGNYTSATLAHGFSTQYTDRETGLVYYGYRYYDPRHGRFINRDPMQEAGGLNLYSFVGNNPANGWDNRGLCFSPILISFLVWVDEWGHDGGHYAVHNEWLCANAGPQPGTGPGDNPGGGGGGGGGGGSVAEKKAKCVALKKALERALNARAAYDGESPAPGWTAAEQWDDSTTGFQATLFLHADTGNAMLSYRGTTDRADWASNINQWVGNVESQYEQAVAVAQHVRRTYGSDSVIVGHSLGGGLGSIGGMITGLETYTYNSAGLHPDTMSRHELTASMGSHIQAYYVDGEILSAGQDALKRYEAVGNRIKLDPHMRWWEYISVGGRDFLHGFRMQIELHGMDRVVRSLEIEIKNNCEK